MTTPRVTVPVEPTEAMLDAARGLIMSLSFGVPNYQTSLSDVARSGYYGELWAHILTDEERAMTGPITKAHRAQLIYRAMLSAAPAPEGGAVPDDVRRLVIAARNVAFDTPTRSELRALDLASEAFASRVPWDDEPEGPDTREEAPASTSPAEAGSGGHPASVLASQGDRS